MCSCVVGMNWIELGRPRFDGLHTRDTNVSQVIKLLEGGGVSVDGQVSVRIHVMLESSDAMLTGPKTHTTLHPQGRGGPLPAALGSGRGPRRAGGVPVGARGRRGAQGQPGGHGPGLCGALRVRGDCGGAGASFGSCCGGGLRLGRLAHVYVYPKAAAGDAGARMMVVAAAVAAGHGIGAGSKALYIVRPDRQRKEANNVEGEE